MKHLLAFTLLVSLTSFAQIEPAGEAPFKAPFEKREDSLCINDWWNRGDNPITDLKVPRDEVVCFGIYTVHNNILKLTAQLYPLYPKETRDVRLEVKQDGEWQEITQYISARSEAVFSHGICKECMKTLYGL